ncbi:RNA polymerase I subunit E [Haematobia irritans]|uniref:RNA polymerase I subunit E n=1 Tax=Haematobia irritans TaxID=7368 RepID=UPI003F502C3F
MKEKVNVEKVYTRKKNSVVPTLMKFQNGKLTAFTKENISFTRLRCKDDASKFGALVVANGNLYQGIVNNSETSELTDTYLCVRNKRTNMMTIIPIDQVNLKNTIYGDLDQVKKSSLSDHVTKMTLLKKYGGRKASRYVNDQEQMRMDISVVQDSLSETVNDSMLDGDEADQVDNTKYFDSIRPPCNKEAEKVSDIYQITDVVPAKLLERLDEEAKTVYQTSIDQIPISSEYLKQLITAIQQHAASSESLQRIKLIIYMDCLLNLIKSRARSLKKTELSKISEKVENNVRERFSDPNSNVSGSRTVFSTEKALCHFIVMAFLINDSYQADAAILSQELNAPRAKVMKYAHIVYGLPKSRTSILALKLPKNVPPLPTKFSRRKKD